MKIHSMFVCRGCSGLLAPGDTIDLDYGYRCVCGWVLREAPGFFRQRWITLEPQS